MQQSLFLNIIRLKKFVINLSIDVLEFDSIPNWYKTQKMCERNVSEDPFILFYCPDRYRTQRVCDEAVDDCQAVLKFIPDWFVTSKMLEKLDNDLHDSFLLNILIIKDINNNFDKNDSDTFIS